MNIESYVLVVTMIPLCPELGLSGNVMVKSFTIKLGSLDSDFINTSFLSDT